MDNTIGGFKSQFIWVDELEQFKPTAWVESGGLERLKQENKKMIIEDSELVEP